ncbi:RsmB/NOP family class I SAM-dependent RNA methyltransferase [Metallosphaera tengchongensis]|uniref:RsmB/NOP family class I SAM-dependent RNA methyltransferase n=1 Tax=Metallosphaera tengchongensis TaxID=1532350 RepID=A0A6N0NUN7_9CREN|nr:RsmB/NOP family class I SAM-dependent RNA methyltransferase [Metallosphaera tengchongensis]QKQ99856.1 RsmB/NOP family class I SAM-dependent RNA methyltransferase [Metallosphaera tengchongensis]
MVNGIEYYLKKNEEKLFSYKIGEEEEKLAEKYGVLSYMVDRYLNFLGSKTEDFLSSCSVPLKQVVRCNTLKTDCDKLVDLLSERKFSLSKIGWSKFGYEVKKSPERPSLGATLEYMKGFYYIQGKASLIPPEVLSPSEEDIVLDMASSPGGKTTHMAQLMKNRGLIIGLEKNQRRIQKIKSNLSRLGVANTILFQMNGEDVLRLGLSFDKILLDAPCSGEGLMPLDPLRKTRTQPEDLKKFLKTQLELLVSAYKALKRGGRLVYSTCSVAPEEDEFVVNFVVKYMNAKIERISGFPAERGLTVYKGIEFEREIEDCIRTYPHSNGMEGFFVCSIRKE